MEFSIRTKVGRCKSLQLLHEESIINANKFDEMDDPATTG